MNRATSFVGFLAVSLVAMAVLFNGVYLTAPVAAQSATPTAIPVADRSQLTPRAVTPELITHLEAFVQEAMTALKVPGAEVGIVQDGRVVFTEGFGVRELGGAEPVTSQTQMMVGSVTKSMTTMMMATVIDDGYMQWDTPVIDIMPQFALSDSDLTRRITVDNLVCNCSGLARRDLEMIFRGDHVTPADLVEWLKTQRIIAPIGEQFDYNNQMVTMGGYVAAIAAGGSLDTIYVDFVRQMEERVWGPIGMASTTFSTDQVVRDDNYASSHGVYLDGEYGVVPFSYDSFLVPVAPAGGAWSNVEDRTLYALTVLGHGVAPNGQRVVSDENLGITMQPHTPISAAPGYSYGLGWGIGPYMGLNAVSHNGGTSGFSAKLTVFPDIDLGVVVLSNAQYADAFTGLVQRRVVELVYGQPSQAHDMLLALPSNPYEELGRGVAEHVDEQAITPYLGRYTSAGFGTVELRLKEGRLVLVTDVLEVELRPHVDEAGQVDRYFAFGPPLLGVVFTFASDVDGQPTMTMTLLSDNPREANTATFTRAD